MTRVNSPVDKVRHLQRQLYLAAKRSRTRRFHALYDRIARPDVLRRAWEQVRRNRGAAGIDAETIADVEAYGVEQMLGELRAQLVTHRYRPQPVRRVYIPKADGRRQRPLGIPRVRDRVLQTALKLVIEPVFEASFRECSYGFRPQRSARQAVTAIRKWVNYGYCEVVEVDIANFFDSVDHELLLGLLARRISDRRVLKLIRQLLRAGVLEEGTVRPTVAGVPQGGVVSPVLANVYLHAFDALFETEAGKLGHLVRYADDLVICCETQAAAVAAHAWVVRTLRRLRLTAHPEKTRVVSLTGGHAGFDFLGFHFRYLRGWHDPSRWAVRNWPDRQAMRQVRARIKAVTGPAWKRHRSIEDIVAEVNPILRGWTAYFRMPGTARQMAQIDQYVIRRLALFQKKKHGWRALGWRHYTPAWQRAVGLSTCAGTPSA
ncbi:MAG: group II intron reverse transcriptase/maturase [Acidimicrobiales bacterium]